MPVSQKKHKVIGHHVAMKFRLVAGLTLSILLFSLATPSSYADTTPSPSPSPSPSSTPLTALEQYKLELEIFKDLVSEREQERKNITKEFMAQVAAANSFAKTAMRTAKTADSKAAILAQQKSAVALAAAERDAAISDLGPAPVEPVKPIKIEPLKSSKLEPLKSSKSPETTTAKKTKSPKASPSSSS
jgi:hypothetical protein